ncbi:MAG: glutaredoxin family protein [bacterium]|nr:glutaredoxin family protein [bacterium]
MEKKITIYTTPWCGYCSAEKEWLDFNKIPYEAKDVEADPEAFAELQAKMGGQFRGVPVTDIDGQLVLGFDRNKLRELLGISQF